MSRRPRERYEWERFAKHPNTIQSLRLHAGDDPGSAAKAARQYATRHGVAVQTCQMGPFLVMYWRGLPPRAY